MKKIILSLLLALATVGGVRAQVGTDFGVNMFVQLKGGINVYNSTLSENRIGFSGGASVGKWILNPLALRLSLDFMTTPEAFGPGTNNSRFALASVEFLWDANATFFRVHDRWYLTPIPFYPMIGLGATFRNSPQLGTDHEFHTMLGAHVPFRIGGKGAWEAFVEYKCNFFPEILDDSQGDVFLHSLVLGMTHNFTPSPYWRRTANESRSVSEDWFIGAGIGPNFTSFAWQHLDKADMYGVAPELMFGRNYSNFWTIRFELGGLTGHGPYDTVAGKAGKGFSFSTLHADVMINLTHAFKYTRGIKLNVLPYLGAGLVWRFDDVHFDMAADFGVMLRYYVGRFSDIYLDAKYLIVPPRIGGGMAPDGTGSGILSSGVIRVGIPSVTVGYIYNFGTNTTRYRLPAHWCPE